MSDALYVVGYRGLSYCPYCGSSAIISYEYKSMHCSCWMIDIDHSDLGAVDLRAWDTEVTAQICLLVLHHSLVNASQVARASL